MGYNERPFFMKKLFVLCVLMSLLFGSCVTAHRGIKADLVVFSDDVSLSYLKNIPANKVVGKGKNTPPYEIGDEEGDKQMRDEIINKVPIGPNTSLYFAKDVARKRVKYVRRKFLTRDPETKIYMIVMTDGLENSSLRAAKNHHMGHSCRNIGAYQRIVKKKTKRAMGKNAWQVYPIVFEGKDLRALYKSNNMTAEEKDDFVHTQFEPMRGAKGAPIRGEDNISPHVIASSSAVDIANKFRDEFLSASFEFHIPKGYVGQLIKMQFSNGSGMIAEFTGILKKRGGNFIFQDAAFSKGLECLTNKNGIWKSTNRKSRKSLVAEFEFNDFKLNDKALIDSYTVAQYVEQQGIWIKNTEYDAQRGQSQNAYIIAILDGSDSVGEDYDEMKTALMSMIKIVTKHKKN